jgi:hypothetical protein
MFQSSFRTFLFPEADASSLPRRSVESLPGADDLVTFGNVSLIAHAAIRSKAIKLSRASLKQTLNTGDRVTGGQIGNLQARAKWIEFNLANPYRRDRVIHDVTDLIRSVALPYLASLIHSKLLRGCGKEQCRGIGNQAPWNTYPASARFNKQGICSLGTCASAPSRWRNIESGFTNTKTMASPKALIQSHPAGWRRRLLRWA